MAESEYYDEDLDFTMYSSMIDLQQQIETLTHLLEEKEAERKELVKEHEKEKKALIKKYEQEIQAVRRNGQIEMAQVVRQNRVLIEEIMSGHEDIIQAWKVQYELDTKNNHDMMMTSPSRHGQDVAAALLVKFKALSSEVQVYVAAGIGTFCLAFRSYSWDFIAWAWPKLENFALKIQSVVGEGKYLVSAGLWIHDFSQSEEFSEFLKIWEQDGVLAIENLVGKYATELIKFIQLLLSTQC